VLGELGGQEVATVIILYLKDPNDRVRANAVEALEQIGSQNIATYLLPLINDKSNRVKANTAKALFSLGNDDAIDILREMILSNNAWMRASAAYVFGEIDSSHSIPYLIQALEDPTWYVVKNVVRALARKGEIAIPSLLNCIRSSNKTRIINGMSTLAEIGDNGCLGALIPLLQNEDGDIREKAEEVIDVIREKMSKQ
jgi:HEAT repeat protein